MKQAFYQVLHVASMVLLTAFLFQAFANPDPKNRKKTMMATGIFAALILIAIATVYFRHTTAGGFE